MMRKQYKTALTVMVAASATIATAGCDDWLTVANPDVIDASTVDPVQDAGTFSLSTLNNLFDALDNAAVYQAWFTGEAYVGDTFTTRQDIAKRQIDVSNGTVTTDVFEPIALAIASGERVQELLADVPDAATNINIARAAFASGYGIILMAETFCEVVISSGPGNLGSPLTPAEAFPEAIERLEKVVQIASANSTAEAKALANAARVGIARANLSLGRYDAAIAAAKQVPADFLFEAARIDDAADRNVRGALNNTVYGFTLGRPSLVVPPYFRALDDPRVPFQLELQNGSPAKTQGLDLDFYKQTKYADYGADIRLASGLEALYIIAEAELKKGNQAPALALIAARSIPTAKDGNDIDFVPTNSTLTELLDQRARDFYLEAQHMGAWLRNPTETPYVLPAGSPLYYDSSIVIGNQTCYPVPDDETDNNPNFPG